VAVNSIDVEDLVDRQAFTAFTLRVLVLALLALIADGFDVQVMSFAAPSLMKAWHLQRAAFAPVFSASLFGILFGAPLFGWIGDHIGRKTCIVLSSITYGLLSLACLTARDLNTLTLLRFLTGVGLGGVMPNAIAIAAELAPRRLRAGMASVISAGITIGGIAPGLIVAQAPPGETWKLLFLVGGTAPLAIAALIALAMPESLGFLVQRGVARARIARLVRDLSPGADIGPGTVFMAPPRPATEPVGLRALFAGELAVITPLLWVMFAATLLSIYMLTSWMPLLLEASGFSGQQAATTNSMFQAGGVIGCVVVSLLLGRFGARLVATLFVLCLVAVGVVARADLPQAFLAFAIAACGFCLVGAQAALNSTAGLAYPTPVRARGLGMALGVGRIGSVIGPLLGGAMVASGVTSARDLFLLPIIPLALGALATWAVMGRLNARASGPIP